MRGKTLLTLALLGFVAVSAVTLVHKEARRKQALAAAEDAARAIHAAPDPSPSARASLPPAGHASPALAPAAPSPPRVIVATYFHTTVRCDSCYRIETYAASDITQDFAGPMAEGRVVWRVVNVDEPENAHFIKDYQLFTKSLVLSEQVGGKEVRWKNLERVWNLLGDQSGFREYVREEVQAFLRETP